MKEIKDKIKGISIRLDKTGIDVRCFDLNI
jgi:hypothetical protein